MYCFVLYVYFFMKWICLAILFWYFVFPCAYMEEGGGDGGGEIVAANMAMEVGFRSGNSCRKTRWRWSQLKSMMFVAPVNRWLWTLWW
ncbi:hypothetical protein QVD17_27734 [Tagetes erecta]|uniref:Uncharacterized protein n=1 Tax=Tagetes erecta TaxID=13708 RepID=A0AAD8K9J9_TARER|nr:hypothetical protein QVD17_27734 [Tagetes erecta]